MRKADRVNRKWIAALKQECTNVLLRRREVGPEDEGTDQNKAVLIERPKNAFELLITFKIFQGFKRGGLQAATFKPLIATSCRGEFLNFDPLMKCTRIKSSFL